MRKLKSLNSIVKLLKGKTVAQVKKQLCGELLGSGVYRDVYVFKQSPQHVIKIERDMSTANFTNVTEWRNYIDLREWKSFSKYLAPCEAISQTGQILVQQRIRHGQKNEYPKQIPAYFTDIKRSNYGWIGTQFVCCDYPMLLSVTKSKNPQKKVNWNKN